MNENKYVKFDDLVIRLKTALDNNNQEEVESIRSYFIEHKAYYEGISFEQLKENIRLKRDAREKLTNEEDIKTVNDQIAVFENTIEGKKHFEKNSKLVEEICNGNYENVEQKTKRIFVKRRLIMGAIVAGLAAAVVLGVKSCNDKDDNNVEETSSATTTTEETLDSTETVEEETDPVEIIDMTDPVYVIDPVTGEPTYVNGYTGTNNGTTGTTNSTTGTTTIVTGTPTPFAIPGVDPDVTVVITYNPDGSIDEITWPTTETTNNIVVPTPVPNGTDPLPVEPTNVVLPDPTDTDRPPVITVTPTPAPVVTPAVPTGDVPGEQPTTYPTESNPAVPTNAPEPAAPTAAPTEPTAAPTLPDIPTWDLDDDTGVITYDLGKTFTQEEKEELGNVLVNYADEIKCIDYINNDKTLFTYNRGNEVIDFKVPAKTYKMVR